MAKVKIPYAPRYPEVHRMMETHRFSVLVAHRRFGKTVLAVNHLIKQAMTCQLKGGSFGYVAPHRNQAKRVAWDYLKHYTRKVPGMRANESELAIELPSPAGPSRLRLFGADNPDALRGLYFDGVIMDEVAQMKPEVWEEIIQPALADRKGFAVFIGTPKGINLFSRLYYFALEKQKENDPAWAALCYPVDKTQALDAEEVARLREELSENKFRQEMLCDFTASNDDTLISLDMVRDALNRNADKSAAAAWPLVIGADIARFGEDATVFFPRRGNLAMPPTILRKKSNLDVAHRLLALISELKPQMVNIDQGQGTGVIDIVADMAPCVVNEVPFGSKALSDKYVNRRAEMWTNMRDWLKNASLPNVEGVNQQLLAELTAPCYSFDTAGRIKLEAKEEIKKRLKHSTDIGDALALTFALPVSPLDTSHAARPSGKRRPYDPFK